jgi:zinc protease
VRPKVEPVTLDATKRLVYEDHVQVPRLYVQWPTVGERDDDRFALDVLGAILSGPRTARLTKELVYDKESAAGVATYQDTYENVGQFLMIITPRPGHSLTDLESAANAVIDRLKADGPTAEEIEKAVAGEELNFLRGLQSNLNKAMRLCDGAGFHGDPGYFRVEYQKTLAVTAGDVKRVANKYLTDGKVVLSIVPVGKPDEAAKPAESQKVSEAAPAAAEAGR